MEESAAKAGSDQRHSEFGLMVAPPPRPNSAPVPSAPQRYPPAPEPEPKPDPPEKEEPKPRLLEPRKSKQDQVPPPPAGTPTITTDNPSQVLDSKVQITNAWGFAALIVKILPSRMVRSAVLVLSVFAFVWAMMYMLNEMKRITYRDDQTERQERAMAALQQQSNEDKAHRLKIDERLQVLETNSDGLSRWVCSRDNRGPQCEYQLKAARHDRWNVSSPVTVVNPVPETRYVEGTGVSILPNP